MDGGHKNTHLYVHQARARQTLPFCGHKPDTPTTSGALRAVNTSSSVCVIRIRRILIPYSSIQFLNINRLIRLSLFDPCPFLKHYANVFMSTSITRRTRVLLSSRHRGPVAEVERISRPALNLFPTEGYQQVPEVRRSGHGRLLHRPNPLHCGAGLLVFDGGKGGFQAFKIGTCWDTVAGAAPGRTISGV